MTAMRMYTSKVLRLPPELREELDRKIGERGLTTVELLSFVRSKKPDADLSRSGLQRYAQRYRAQLERYREERLMGTAVAEALGKAAHGDVEMLISQMLRLIVFQNLRPALEGETRLKTEETLKVATTVHHMASADKLVVESAVIRREENALKREEEARQAKQAKLADLSGEKIRRALLGIDDEHDDK